MSRVRADLLLLLTSLIWGAAFVAQKNAFDHVGAYTFVAARFLLSALLVLPFAARERHARARKSPEQRRELALLCAAFCIAVILQQAGIAGTSVANAGFLTGLYVVFVPVICRFVYKQRMSPWIYPAALLSVAGLWLLTDGGLDGLSSGDGLVLGCALGFALQVVLVGRVMAWLKAPFSLAFLQYAAVAVLAFIGAMVFEQPSAAGLKAALLPILYAGAISGGIAYTLQIVAQQYAPAPDAAIILSGEAVFAALAGAWLLDERLTEAGYAGCGLIVLAILVVEAAPLLFRTMRKGG